MTAVDLPEAAPATHFFEGAEGDGAFGYDPVIAVEHLRAADPGLARLVEKVGPFRMQLTRTPSIFVALTESVVYQQLHGKAAAAIYARLCALFPGAVEGPSAEQILGATDDQLRSAGLSRSKMLSIQDLARHARDGEIPTLAQAHGMTDDDLVERLSVVRGIGRWTVEMLLIFRLGRPDVLPVDDFGVRKGFWHAFRKRGEPDKKVLAAHGERWRPYRSVASWYLWRAASLAPRPKPTEKAPTPEKKAPPKQASPKKPVAAKKAKKRAAAAKTGKPQKARGR